MKLQLFFNGNLYAEEELPLQEFNTKIKIDFDGKVINQNTIDFKKKKLDRYITAFKNMYEHRIKEAYSWEIMVSVMSKINKQSILKEEERPVVIKEQEVVLVRPIAKYSNSGYLKLTGS